MTLSPELLSGLDAETVRSILDYDPVTGVFVWKVRSANLVRIGDIAGTVNSRGYNRIMIKRVGYLSHRLAWLYVHGVWPPNQIDHINRQRTDNRIANLRLATRSQNNANSPVRSVNKVGIKGVSLSDGRYLAQIKVNGKKHYLGQFATPEEAGAAYVTAAKQHFGEFAEADLSALEEQG